jgi:putative peptidoglycan lipid II flippase
VLWFAMRAGHIAADATLKSSLAKLAIAGAVFALFLFMAAPAVTYLLSSLPRFRYESQLIAVSVLGAVVYGVLVLALFGKRWLSIMRRRARSSPGEPLDAFEGTSAPAASPDEI